MKILFSYLLLVLSFCATAQSADSIKIEISYSESEDFKELLLFENINFQKFRLTGEYLKGKHYILTSQAYWDGIPYDRDTIVNSHYIGFPHQSATMDIHVMARQELSDSVRMQFRMPLFYTYRKFLTTKSDSYSLQNILSSSAEYFPAENEITLMVYTLPYEDPARPGYKLYCELSQDGTPPEKWYEKFGVKHLVIYRLMLEE